MARQDDGLDDLARAFAEAMPAKPGRGARYPAHLKDLVVAAVGRGAAQSDVMRATRVPAKSLKRWLARARRRSSAKTRVPGSAKKCARQFRRLAVIDGGCSTQVVSMFVGRDVRLEVPVDLLSAEFVRSFVEAAS